MQIPVLLGSQRSNSNSSGLSQWLVERAIKSGTQLSLDPSIPVPYHSVFDPVIAAGVKDAKDYEDPAVTAWSKLVSSSPAIVILTPQFNWGYPGGLKNAIDHLYHEWQGKPILLITFGGHGGSRCAAQLKDVLEGGVNAKLVETVMIQLPSEFIRTGARVRKGEAGSSTEGQWPEFLSKHEKTVEEALKNLKQVIDGAANEDKLPN